MKNEEIYQHLKEIAEKVQVEVVEKNLHLPGLRAKSGLCIVEGKKMFIMDKRKTLKEKTEILLECICHINTENIFIIPQMRELIEKSKKKYSTDNDEYYTLFDE